MKKSSKVAKHIYVATHDYTSLIKIGASATPQERARQIEFFCGADVDMLYESVLTPKWRHMELRLHSHFAEQRRHGEWFDLSPEEAIEVIKHLEIEYDEGYTDDILAKFKKPEVIVQDVLFVAPYTKFYKVTDSIYRDKYYHYYIDYEHNRFNLTVKTPSLSKARELVRYLSYKVRPHKHESAIKKS